MKNYQKINNIAGWIVFSIAAFVYLSTIEQTGSFWDCGEFIATANKLEVGHPPGAPLFMILARVFILFAGDNLQMIPVMVNIMSALMSAFTILFLFWTITHLARKIIVKAGEITQQQIMAIMGAGSVGALCYTFSDSFWFSAVEGEVYASSSFFTAIVFWAILKWENAAGEKHSAKWLILIAYLMGLSIGVHLLNLLTIPAIAFVYYFRKYSVSKAGIIYTSIISLVILGAIQFGPPKPASTLMTNTKSQSLTKGKTSPISVEGLIAKPAATPCDRSCDSKALGCFNASMWNVIKSAPASTNCGAYAFGSLIIKCTSSIRSVTLRRAATIGSELAPGIGASPAAYTSVTSNTSAWLKHCVKSWKRSLVRE